MFTLFNRIVSGVRSFSTTAANSAARVNSGPDSGKITLVSKPTGNDYSVEEKNSMKLSNPQAEAAVGILLGDGSCKQGLQGTVLLFSQSVVHTLYFLCVFSLYFDLIGTYPYLMSRWAPTYKHYTYS